ncbi:exonuclease SbcCD subunit D C-terminal domain-containing protein [Parathalassolituus penaei]|uniref:Nuclease SbcCD subunit D n=1 Tax=Parathalassolituus penaei TaxID=2997323 RepID=A0A9X3EEV1_9GAMM|nr:exonuclease SbcCD subunit D C-terminal domain-containing protein [Parathalassolituus penaei]MCY0965425.1 exonuclease SbcCD subunit D C-terminal domain-containing protein [Parathalassolituus penaei]
MRVLHTSDWHLGRVLYGRKRHDEFEAFLKWLLATLAAEQVDVLVVAGDVFDTSAPGNRAQELYYRFLCDVAATGCRYVVILAGNHDSPSFLQAPQALLRALDIHVVGAVSDDLADELLILRNAEGQAELLVCAVPYLRDRDIRLAEAGERTDAKDRKLQDGIREHYARIGELAEALKGEIGPVPVLATGHLFAAGGQTVDGDGVRELYVGSLAHVSASVFPPVFDYVALGHLHVPQKVAGCEHIRYSGSPLPMGFAEAAQQKQVCLVDMMMDGAHCQLVIRSLPVPVFRSLESVRGDMDTVLARLQALRLQNKPLWLEVICDTDGLASDVRQALESAVEGTQLDILRVRHNRLVQAVLQQGEVDESLDDLTEQQVFDRCLDAHEIEGERRDDLLALYHQVVQDMGDQVREASEEALS